MEFEVVVQVCMAEISLMPVLARLVRMSSERTLCIPQHPHLRPHHTLAATPLLRLFKSRMVVRCVDIEGASINLDPWTCERRSRCTAQPIGSRLTEKMLPRTEINHRAFVLPSYLNSISAKRSRGHTRIRCLGG